MNASELVKFRLSFTLPQNKHKSCLALVQTSYMLVQQSLASFPSHADSKDLLAQLATHFQTL